MSAETVQDAIVKQLRNDADILTSYGKVLTGTLTFTNGSSTVTGVGTAFLSELRNNGRDGYVPKKGAIRDNGSTEWYRVLSVESDISLTLSSNFDETTAPGVAGDYTNVCKGMGRNFSWLEDKQGLRVFLMLENFSQTTLPFRRQDAVYPFLLIGLFYEPDDEDGEARKTQYSSLIRQAIHRDWKLSASMPLGETITLTELKDTRHFLHEAEEGGYSMAIPLGVRRKELVT